MNVVSATLAAGDHAPAFSLMSANGEQPIALASLLQRGPTIIEFLRGTW